MEFDELPQAEPEHIAPASVPDEAVYRASWGRRAWRVLTKTLRIILFTLLGLYLLVQLPVVQNWLRFQITNYLSKAWGMEVTADRLYVDYYDVLVLQNFLIIDQQQDTLLHTGLLRIEFGLNPIKIFNSEYEIRKVILEGGHVVLRRSAGEFLYNYDPILKWLSPTKKSGGAAPKLKIGDIVLRKFLFEKNDQAQGNLLAFDIGELSLRCKTLDLAASIFHLQYIEAKELALRINKIPADLGALDSLLFVTKRTIQKDTSNKTPTFIIDKIRLKNNIFNLDNYVSAPFRTIADTLLDYAHLNVSEIDVEIDSFRLEKGVFNFQLPHISAREASGFELNKLRAKTVMVSAEGAALYGMRIETPYSSLGDTIKFMYNQYSDFNTFVDDVKMDLRFSKSKIELSDIVRCANKLSRNPFFERNKNTNVEIDGRCYGSVNSLNGKNLSIRLGSDTYLKANFSTNELTRSDETNLNIRFDRLVTSPRTLRELIPNFKAPPAFDRLGRFDLSEGTITGFYQDLVIEGLLRTDIGSANLNTKFDFKNGNSDIGISGKVELDAFNLGILANSTQLGKVSLQATVKNGHLRKDKGFDGDLELTAAEFMIGQYAYKKVHYKGHLDNEVLEGQLELDDPNATLKFDGKLNLGAKKSYQFEADITKLDLAAIKLVQQPFVVSGLVVADVQGSNLKTLRGTVSADGLKIINARNNTFVMDSLQMSMTQLEADSQRFVFRSDIGSIDAVGQFRLDQLVNAWTNYVYRHYPTYAKDLQLTARPGLEEYFNFSVAAKVFDAKNWTTFVDPKFTTLKGLTLSGFVKSGGPEEIMQFNIAADEIAFDRYKVAYISLRDSSFCDESSYSLDIYKTQIGDSTTLAPFSLSGNVTNENLSFRITSRNLEKRIENLDISGQLTPAKGYYRLEFSQAGVGLFGDKWTVTPGSYMMLSRDTFETNNFSLFNAKQRIELKSRSAQGIDLVVENLDLEVINPFLKTSKFKFKGPFDLRAGTNNVFKLDDLKLDLKADSTFINQMHLGILEVVLDASDPKSPFNGYFALTDTASKASATGQFNYLPPAVKQQYVTGGKKKPNHLFGTLELTNMPIAYLKLLIQNGISDLTGKATGRVAVQGDLKNLDIDGLVLVRNVGVTIGYTQARYFVDSANIKINNYEISADNQVLRDAANRKATISGGLTHNRFKSFGLDCDIKTNGFQALNTTATDNPLYYGTAVVAGDIRFSGDFERTNISIKARSLPGTFLKMPFTDEERANKNNFVRFIDSRIRTDTAIVRNTGPNGVNIEMNLDVTPDADIWLIFNEQAGDIIKGSGSGNLRIGVNRSGEFTMNGRYEISKGDYLFTLLNVVNKPFVVKPGGTITWSGDPLEAIINLNAEYKGLNTATYNFIAEYLGTEEERQLASQTTQIDLGMKMQGRLMKPEVTFSLGFPQLQGVLKSYTDSKLRTTALDPNELNRQVFGLVVVGGFLPSSQALGSASSGAINTVTEMLTNQLSLLLTGFLNQYTTGLNVNVDYSRFQVENLENNANIGDEWRVTLRKDNLFNNRVAITGGVGVENNASGTSSSTFVGSDVLVELYITQDRRLKLTAYNTNDQDLNGRRNRFGSGIAYRQEFDTWTELVANLPGRKRTRRQRD